MSYDNNDVEYEQDRDREHDQNAPKKADVLIQSTQTIVSKQEELGEQTKLAISRIDEAIELCNKNSQEASSLLEHSTEMFDKLHAENSALKQELLYLAKQSENIYAGLAEKLNEIGLKTQAQSPEEPAVGKEYYELADRLNEIYDRLAEMTARIDAISTGKAEGDLNEKFAILYDKIDAVAVDNAKPVQSMDGTAIMDRLDRIMESVRKNEGAHSMLADKFEILSMRVEQFGIESARTQPVNVYPQPAAAYPSPVQPAEIDYDKLASKVADILSVRENVSPDYIASKVAEQIIMPEQVGAEIDTQKIAEEVAALIDVKPAEQTFDEDAIVAKLADKVGEIVTEAKAEPLDREALADMLADRVGEIVCEAKPIDEDAFADKLAERLSSNEVAATSVASVPAEIDEQALADAIAQRLNSVETVAAVPAEIDEQALADAIAERLNITSENEVTSDTVEFDDDALVEKIASRIEAVIAESAPAVADVNIDQEELADSIALKVGSLKPEDFEILVDDAGCASITKEITEKLDYQVISDIIADKLRDILDLNAANAPDYEDMAERISEKITVAGINEDAIADKAAAVLSNYLPEFDTEEIADKVTGAVIDVVSAMPQPTLDSEAICNEITERLIERQQESDYDLTIDDDGISKITAIVTEEVGKDTEARFAKLEESLAKIQELLEPVEEESGEEQTDDIEVRFDRLEDGIARLQELLEPAEEETAEGEEEQTDDIEVRFDRLEDGIARIQEMLEPVEEETAEGEEDIEYVEDVGEEQTDGVDVRLERIEDGIARIQEMLTPEEEEETEEYFEEESDADEEVEEPEEEEIEGEEELSLAEVVATEIEKGTASRFDKVEEDIAKIYELVSNIVVEEEVTAEQVDSGVEYEDADYSHLSEIVACEIEKGVSSRLDNVEEKLTSLTEMFENGIEEEVEEGVGAFDSVSADGLEVRFDRLEDGIARIQELLEAEEEEPEEEEPEEAAEETVEEADGEEEYTEVEDGEAEYPEEDISEEEYARISEMLTQIESNLSSRFDSVEEKITSLTELMTVEEEETEYADEEGSAETEDEIIEETDGEEEYAVEDDGEYARLSEIVSARFDSVEEKINTLTELISGSDEEYAEEEYEDATEEDYTKLSEIVAAEVEKGVAARFDSVEDNIRKINAMVAGLAVSGVVANGEQPNSEFNVRLYEQFDKVAYDIKKISEYVSGDVPVISNERMDRISNEIAKIAQLVEGELSLETNARLDKLQEEFEKLNTMLGGTTDSEDSERLERLEGGVDAIKDMLIGGAVMSTTEETAATQTAEPEYDEQELVTVSDLVKPIATVEEEDEEDDGDFLLSALDMDNFSEDERMPGEFGDFENGVDFENMMKYNRSFIARIIQSDDNTKQYYGAVKHALLSYKKVNSNVAWGNERFNKGRETIARMKIRGKTLVIYLALDPNEYKTSVYHHADVSDNKSVLGTPMMIKVKSPLGVRKAIRLIDEMLAKRDGEKREVPERDYAAMYPYETIAELIEDGLVKDVRKK